ncbi:MAG: hypothetical protein Kow00121_46970 [Elainellaceae cyanobacterium]
MTQPHLIEQAKQGDPQAIAALMNKSLQPKGMTALVERRGDYLEVVLEAERVPNRQALTAFVEKGIHNLGIGSIRSIRVLGQQIGAEAPAWTHDLDLQTFTPEFEPEPSFDAPDSYLVSEELPPDHLDSDQIPTSPPDPLTSDSDSLFADLATDPSESSSEDALLNDLSQLQGLLSDQPEQPFSETQRQELEERLKSLWAEQSQEPQDFLTELMSDQSSGSESDDFLADQLDADLTPTEDFNSLWTEEPTAPDPLLADTVSIETAASEDFQSFFTEPSTEPSVEPTDTSAEFWMNEEAEAETDEPDEILLGFLEEQPILPQTGVDESGDLLDEPDEILPGFLESQPESSAETGSASGDLSDNYLSDNYLSDHSLSDQDLSDSQTEDLSALFAEDSAPSSDFFAESTGTPDQDFSLGTSDSFQDASDEEDFLTLLDEQPEQEQTLTETSFFDDQNEASDQAIDNLFAVSSEDAGTEENGRADYVEDIGLNTEDDWSTEPMAEPADATLLEFEQEPETDFTFDAIDSSDETADSAASWDQPPIEFLNGEPDLPQPEMPTEQFNSSTPDFESDSQFDFASPIETPLGDQVEGFPQGFLQEFSEASSDENLSDELFVEPHENPFMENMEGRNQEGSSDLPPSDEQWNQFNPSDWQPTNEDQPLGADDQAGTEDPLSLFPDTTDASNTTDTNATDTTDEALINFFAEESSDTSETIEEPNSSWQASETWQPSESWEPSETWQPSSNFTESDLDLEGETEPVSGYTGGADYPSDSPSDYSSEDWSDSSSSFTPSDYSDFQFTDNSLTDSSLTDNPPDDRPEPDQSPEDFSVFGMAAPGTTSLPDTEIPNTQLPDTQIPTYSESSYGEPSQAALEEQLADFDMGNQPVAATAPAAPVTEPEAPPESRSGSPWLFPLILLGISGWIVGLISFAFLWSRLSSPPPSPDAATTVVPVDGSDPIAAAGVCSAPPETPNSTPVALSSMQFQPNEGNPQQVNLVGCVTNRTQQPIDIVSVLYQSGSGNNTTVGGLNLPDNLIQPGQSVSFSSKFTLPSDTNSIAINTIYWQPAGTTTSQETRTSIVLNR